MDPHLRLRTSPVARPDAVVSGERWRITVLTAGLVRLEWAEDGVFEDRASTFALHRDLPVPAFETVGGEAALEIVTERLRLTYDRGPFSPAGLSIQARGNVSNYRSVWRYGEPPRDLGGTTRTLDDIDGPAPLESGIVSRYGIASLDDSSSFLFEDDGWVSPRDGSKPDVYVFAYAHDYAEAIQAFYAVSGPQPAGDDLERRLAVDDVELRHWEVAVDRERRGAVLEAAVLGPLEPQEAVAEHGDAPAVALDDGLGPGDGRGGETKV